MSRGGVPIYPPPPPGSTYFLAPLPARHLAPPACCLLPRPACQVLAGVRAWPAHSCSPPTRRHLLPRPSHLVTRHVTSRDTTTQLPLLPLPSLPSCTPSWLQCHPWLIQRHPSCLTCQSARQEVRCSLCRASCLSPSRGSSAHPSPLSWLLSPSTTSTPSTLSSVPVRGSLFRFAAKDAAPSLLLLPCPVRSPCLLGHVYPACITLPSALPPSLPPRASTTTRPTRSHALLACLPLAHLTCPPPRPMSSVSLQSIPRT